MFWFAEVSLAGFEFALFSLVGLCRKENLLQQPVREPEIFYVPDERDDFDAEDPDEDLNIWMFLETNSWQI